MTCIEDAPRFEELAASLKHTLDAKLLVTHNARFDYGFLKNEFRRVGVNFAARVLCTVRLSRALYPEQEGHSLDAVIERHDLKCARRHRALATWRVDESQEFHVPSLVAEPDFVPGTGTAHFGLFRNRRAVREKLRKLCAQHGLCPVKVGLEKTGGPCFAYQLGRCRGACSGKEAAPVHNLRLASALASIRISSWPFAGAVGLKETDRLRGRESIHVIDNWCWLGSAESEREIPGILDGHGRVFDLDTYRILRTWLDKKAHRISVINLGAKAYSGSSSG